MLKKNDDDDVILMEEASPPVNPTKDLDEDEGRRQATTHISVSPDVVLASTGEEREKWLAAGRKEIDNLTIPKAITALSPQERTALKEKAQLEGEDFIELPAKVVFTIKPEKYKIRIVACGNQTKDTYGKITTTDLDTCMLRFILSWAASSRFNTIASLDVTAAFLNADLPPGRVVVLRPPTVLYKLGLIPTGFVWRVHRAVYGLREAPSLWSKERTKVMETMTFRSRGESYRVLISEIHRSILLLVREQDVLKSPQLTYAGLNQRVQPKDVMALCGIYVDDYLSVGPLDIVTSFLEHLRSIWKTTEPVFLTPGMEFSFLGITLELTTVGLLLHQKTYTEALLEEYKDVTPKRQRATTGEPEHFDKDAKSPPDMTNPEHVEWVKRAQKILGALLWLSTRTRPDIACAVSLAAQSLWHNLDHLKIRLRHLLQYLNTTKTFGLLYTFPQKEQPSPLSEFTVFADSSFAPSGKHSQTGYVILLSFGNVRHLIHWHSTREKKVAESSAESELYALCTSFKTARNFRLLIHETITTEVIMNMRCDNTAALAMIDEPSWRTRYISIYGESLRQEVLKRHLIITYVTTDLQLADPLTKPKSIKINVHLLPLLGLVTCNHIISLALQEEGDESAWSTAFYSAADLLRRVLYALLTTNIRLNLKN